MKVLYLCGQFGVPDEDRCRALATAGHDVLVFSYYYTESYKWDLKNDLAVKVIQRGPNNKARLFRNLGAYGCIKEVMRFSPDVCVVYSYQRTAFFIAAVLARLKGAFCITMNDSMFDDYVRFILSDLAKYVMLLPYQAALTATKRAATYVQYLGVQKTSNYYCAIDTSRVRHSAPRTNTPFAERNFISVARFIRKKNHLLMLDAFETFVGRTGSKRRLLLCGYGPLEEEIKARIAQSDLLARQVDILGYLPVGDVAKEVEKSLALLLPSSEEQFGIVVTEAFSVGVPAVITDYCGAREIISNGLNGYVVELGDPDSLARAMEKLAADEVEWNRMREAALEGANRADTAVFVEGVEELASRKPSRIEVKKNPPDET